MRRLLAAAAAAAALLTAGCMSDASAPQPAPPSNVDVDTPQLRAQKEKLGIEPCPPGTATDGPLPAVTLPCFGGGPDVDLSTLEGPLVLNFWQSTCGPCKKEMPALQEFHEQHGDRVPIIGVDYLDVLPEGAMDLARRTGVTYPLVADPGGELQGTDLRPIGLPTFVFVPEDGEPVLKGGGIESSAELVELVEKNLGVRL